MWPTIAAAMLFSFTAAAAQNDAPPTETQKIESLISHVESLKDAKFVRNGVAYDAKTAGQFLRGKWKAQESNIKTARDFISKAASVSSTTGQPYLIRLSDGKETKSGEYLSAELEKLEIKKSGGQQFGARHTMKEWCWSQSSSFGPFMWSVLGCWRCSARMHSPANGPPYAPFSP